MHKLLDIVQHNSVESLVKHRAWLAEDRRGFDGNRVLHTQSITSFLVNTCGGGLAVIKVGQAVKNSKVVNTHSLLKTNDSGPL